MSFHTALEAYTIDSTSAGAVQAIFIPFINSLTKGLIMIHMVTLWIL